MRTMFTAIAAASLFGLASSVASAQAVAVYYYPAAGLYDTTQGLVSIPTPGYYYNVPSVPAPAWNPAPRVVTSTAPRTGFAPRRTYPTIGGRGGFGSTPFYSGGGSGGTPHYLHGRGYDSGGHR